MNIFYSIMSVVFCLLSYLISRENGNSVLKSVLIGVFVMILWPVIIAAAAVYLLIGRLRKQGIIKDNFNEQEEMIPEEVKEAIDRIEANGTTDEVVEQTPAKEWQDINESEEEQ